MRTEVRAETAPGVDQDMDVELLPTPLPPLPAPNKKEQLAESACGASLVSCLVGTFCAVTIGFGTQMAEPARSILISLIVLEAVIAFGCLAGLLWGDPGVIRRTAETCFPVPSAVAERLAGGGSTSGMSNIVDGGRTYCVRCFLWREHNGQPPVCISENGCTCERSAGGLSPMSTHHCSTCQRCVRYFDHHCGVFGRCARARALSQHPLHPWRPSFRSRADSFAPVRRCIAGRGLEGNIKYFYTIIIMGWCGAVTAGAALVMGLIAAGARR